MSRVVAFASTSVASFGRDTVITKAVGKSRGVRAPRHPASHKHVGSTIARRAAATAEARLALQNSFDLRDLPLADGTTIIVRPMRPTDVKQVAEVMRVAFEGTPDERPRARVAKYLIDRLEPDPDQVVLVGIRDGDAIAVASLSFTDKARGNPSSDTTLQSGSRQIPCPTDAAYLCNVAVDEGHREKGVAKNILTACESFTREMGHSEVWLHVRSSEQVAFGLYTNAGYKVVSRESPSGPMGVFGKLSAVLGGDAVDVALMRKTL